MKGQKNHPRARACTELYAEALLDPFSPKVMAEAPCSPLVTAVPTRKFASRATITWGTGTGGYGYVLIRPNYTWSSSPTPLVYTDASFTDIGSDLPVTSGTGVYPVGVVSPFSAAASADTKVRLVSWGSRTNVITPGLERGGDLYQYNSSLRRDLTAIGSPTLAGARSLDETSVATFSAGGRSSFEFIGGAPTQEFEKEFVDSTDSRLTWTAMVVGYSATHSVSQTFRTDFVFHWEIYGENTTGKTSSHADPAYAAPVLAVVNDFVVNNPAHEPHESFRASAWRAIRRAWAELSSLATPANVAQAAYAAASAAGGDYAPAGALVYRGAQRALQPKKKKSKKGRK